MWNFFSLIFKKKEEEIKHQEEEEEVNKNEIEMKHPFQIILSDKKGETLYIAVKHHIQVFNSKTGDLIGSWTDEVETSDLLKKQQEAKIKALEEKQKEELEKLSEEPAGKKLKTATKAIKIPKIPTPGPGAPPIYNYIRTLRLSHDEKYLIGSTDVDKAAVIFKVDLSNTENVLTLLKRQVFPKRPCAISTDFKDENIILADKFGDVYSLPLTDESVIEDLSKLTLVLGHVSMLSDVTLCHNDAKKEFIITADRDEHIKISNYPKAYVLSKMLFGHREFVSNLVIPQWNNNLLISAGGDDFFCFWNWSKIENNLIARVEIRDLVQEYLNDNHLPPERFLTEDSPREIAVTKILSIDEHKLIILLVEQTNAILVYQINETDDNIEYKQTLNASANVIDITNDENGLLYVSLDVESSDKLIEIFKIENDNSINLLPEQDKLVENISVANTCVVESRDEFYPLYHANALRKRSEH